MVEASANAIDRDVHEIEAIIARQFGSLSWSPGTTGTGMPLRAIFSPVLIRPQEPPKTQTANAFETKKRVLVRRSIFGRN